MTTLTAPAPDPGDYGDDSYAPDFDATDPDDNGPAPDCTNGCCRPDMVDFAPTDVHELPVADARRLKSLPEAVAAALTARSTISADTISPDKIASYTIPANPLPLDPKPRRSVIIGFSGRLRSGKDTAAQVLIDNGFHHASFAQALKDFLYALNPLIATHGGGRHTRLVELVDGVGWEQAKDDYPEVRALLQRLGTEAGRGVMGQDIWVQTAMRNLPPSGDVVFTDVRFPNEANAIRDMGGFVIRVERASLPPLTEDAHESETALDGYPFDMVVDNDGTVVELHAAVALAMFQFARR